MMLTKQQFAIPRVQKGELNEDGFQCFSDPELEGTGSPARHVDISGEDWIKMGHPDWIVVTIEPETINERTTDA